MALRYLDAQTTLTKAAKENNLLEFVDDGIRRRFSTIITSFNRNGIIAEQATSIPLALAADNQAINAAGSYCIADAGFDRTLASCTVLAVNSGPLSDVIALAACGIFSPIMG